MAIPFKQTLFVGFLLFAAGCNSSTENRPADGRLPVSVGISPVAFLVEQIGREHVSVEVLVPASQDPHASILVGGRRRVKEPTQSGSKPPSRRSGGGSGLGIIRWQNIIISAYGRTHTVDRYGQGGGLSSQVESKDFGLGALPVAQTIRPERAGRL